MSDDDVDVDEIPLRKILVPLDGSEWSFRAAKYAIKIAKIANAQIVCVHAVVSLPTTAYANVHAGILIPRYIEEAIAAMYAYEMELPKISRSKIDGLKKLYGMDSEDATKYFEIHEEADVRHAQVWREILQRIPAERHEAALNAAIKSLQAQNMLLDSVHEKYVGGMYC